MLIRLYGANQVSNTLNNIYTTKAKTQKLPTFNGTTQLICKDLEKCSDFVVTCRTFFDELKSKFGYIKLTFSQDNKICTATYLKDLDDTVAPKTHEAFSDKKWIEVRSESSPEETDIHGHKILHRHGHIFKD